MVLHATFMPKPLFGVNGSGMHCNLSLFKGSENAFYDQKVKLELSETARPIYRRYHLNMHQTLQR